MKPNVRHSRTTAATAAAIALTALPLVGCADNRLPQVAIPTNDQQLERPRWYPEQPWTAKDGDGRVYIEGKIVFDTDKATIRAGTSEKVLMTLHQFLIEHPEVTLLRVEGHTDNRGSDEHNMELSARRSLTVCDWLVDHGVDNTRLIAVGFGKSRPIAPNGRSDGMQENRRSEFHVAEVNGRPFIQKDPANGGYALTVKSAEQRKAEREAALHPPPKATAKPWSPEGDVVKPIDVNRALQAQQKEREKKERQKAAPADGGGEGGN
jgi:outer membrane protein OmpA-like peptidoglycan-associated protein